MSIEYRVMVDHELFGWDEIESGLTELEAIELRDKIVEQHCDGNESLVRIDVSDEFGVYWG